MRTNVGVIFGGKSVEHEISIISAVEAMGYFDTNKYNVIPIYIDKNNVWYTGSHLKDIINYRDMALVKRYSTKVTLINKNNSFYLQTLGLIKRNIYVLDLAFPIGHGAYLEDGSLQGYLEMVGIPYVGSNVIGSALGMDKVIMKQLLKENNIPVPNYVWFYDEEYANKKKSVLERINTLKYPLFIKPACLGSSIGITKIDSEERLVPAINEAIKFDKKIIVEEAIKNTKEVNVSVLGDYKKARASEIEEINTSDEFFTFKEKYVENYSKLIKNKKKTKPLFSKEMKEDIKNTAIKTFNVLNASGVARVDFLLDDKNNKFYVSEINTIPGSLSSFLWLANNKSQSELIDDLINISIDNYKSKKEKTFAFPGNLLESFDLKKGSKFKNKQKK